MAEPGQFRAEFFDRIAAPIYPLAFVVIAFMYLGAPRTTRQSRAMSIIGAIAGVGALRLIGFASSIIGVNQPLALSAQYLAMLVTFGFGLFAISRGLIIEPPAFVTNAITAVTERLTPRPVQM
jgi:lipopolysaccharide export system permease protein